MSNKIVKPNFLKWINLFILEPMYLCKNYNNNNSRGRDSVRGTRACQTSGKLIHSSYIDIR